MYSPYQSTFSPEYDGSQLAMARTLSQLRFESPFGFVDDSPSRSALAPCWLFLVVDSSTTLLCISRTFGSGAACGMPAGTPRHLRAVSEYESSKHRLRHNSWSRVTLERRFETACSRAMSRASKTSIGELSNPTGWAVRPYMWQYVRRSLLVTYP